MKEKDQLEVLRERYESDGIRGDLAEAARNANVSGPVVSTALSKKSWRDLSKAERRTMLELRKIMNKRREEELEALKN